MSEIALSWMLTYLLHSTLLLGAAWLATRLLSDEALAVKETLWRAALIGGILTAGLQVAAGVEPLLGGWRLGAAPPPATPATEQGVAASPSAAAAGESGAGFELPSSRPAAAPPRQSLTASRPAVPPPASAPLPAGGGGWLLAVWALGAFALAGRLAASCLALARRLAGRRAITGGALFALLLRLLRAARLTGVGLSASPRIGIPLAFGWRRREICLPERVVSGMGEEQQELVLAHELAHHARRDPVWLIAGRLIESLLFFQPLNRLARRRLQEIAEYRCDDWAVERTGRPVTLARCLADVAQWSLARGGPLPVPTLASKRRRLGRRVERLLDRSYPLPAPRRPRWLAAGVGCALALAVLFAPGVSRGHPPAAEAPAAPEETTAPEVPPAPEAPDAADARKVAKAPAATAAAPAPGAPPAPRSRPAVAAAPRAASSPSASPSPALAPVPSPQRPGPPSAAPAPPAPAVAPPGAPDPPPAPDTVDPTGDRGPVPAPASPRSRLAAPRPPAAAPPASESGNGEWVLHEGSVPPPPLPAAALDGLEAATLDEVGQLADSLGGLLAVEQWAVVAGAMAGAVETLPSPEVLAQLVALGDELGELSETGSADADRLAELSRRLAQVARPDPEALARIDRLRAELARRAQIDPEVTARIAALSHDLAAKTLPDPEARALLEAYANQAAADRRLSDEEREELARLRAEFHREMVERTAAEREELARLREEMRREIEAGRPDREELARLREEMRREISALRPDREELERLREEMRREVEADPQRREEMARAHEEARRRLDERLRELERERSERHELHREVEEMRREERARAERHRQEIDELRAEIERLREELRREREDGGG